MPQLIKIVLGIFLSTLFVSFASSQGPEKAQRVARISRDGKELFSKIHDSWSHLPFKATKQYYFQYNGKLFSQKELYIVSFSKSGKRKFFQKLISTSDPSGEGREKIGLPRGRKAFDLNVAFKHRYRDFRIFNPFLAEANYNVIPMGRGIVCGRRVLSFNLTPKKPTGGSFFVQVDQEVGYVLSSYCFDSNGLFVSASLCLEFDIGYFALPKNEKWWSPRYEVKTFINLPQGVQFLGYPIAHLPRPPEGYSLELLSGIRQPKMGMVWLAFLYSDGIVPQFLLFGRKNDASFSIVERNQPGAFKVLQRGSFFQVNGKFGELEVIFVGPGNGVNELPDLLLSIYS